MESVAYMKPGIDELIATNGVDKTIAKVNSYDFINTEEKEFLVNEIKKRKKNMKYIVITTFPNKDWYEYLHIGTMTYLQYFPAAVPLCVKIFKNEMSEVVNESLTNLIQNTKNGKEGRKVHIETGSTQEEIDFYERHKDYKNEGDYRTNYIDFSHKIFALYQAYLFAKQQEIDYIIWMDADIITKSEVTIEDIEKWHNGADIAYLGRKDWDHSECGVVIYKTETAGKFIELFHHYYVNDRVLNLEQYHDSYVFDEIRSDFPDLKYHNISEGIEGRDVFNISILGEKLQHFKGPKEKQKLIESVRKIRTGEKLDTNQAINVNDVIIKTKNCVDKEVIRANIEKNVRMIKNWYAPCKKTEEKIIICSAGPSLDPIEIKKYYDKGHKIVAVKHALKPLQKAGIIPWAVILLDPRGHVADFVDNIHKDSIVFVASMVDPIVIDKLLSANLKVIGYHVAVGANEVDFLRNGDCLIVGGSATSTRGISVLEGLGFSNMELFGYDCSYHEKPDLQEKKENGTLKYEEVTLEVETYGEKKIKRTFWTEGQFLAQLQEFRNYYFVREGLNLNIHGDGMIPWIWRNKLYYKQYLKEQEEKSDKKALPLDEYIQRLNFNA